MASASDDPAYLEIGLDVSAKFKGAFCEAKIKTCKKLVKCKVTFKDTSLSTVIHDCDIKGELKYGALVEAKDVDGEWIAAVITKVQDCSVYTVKFDDNDERTVRRSAVKLMGERHYNESDNLDNLPLTDPECFGTPVFTDSSGKIMQMSAKRKSREGVLTPMNLFTGGLDDKDEVMEKAKLVAFWKTENKFEPVVLVNYSCVYSLEEVRSQESTTVVRLFDSFKLSSVSVSELCEFDSSKNEDDDSHVEAFRYLESHQEETKWLKSWRTFYEGKNEVFDIPCDVSLFYLFLAVDKYGGFAKVASQSLWVSVQIKVNKNCQSSFSVTKLKTTYKKYLHDYEQQMVTERKIIRPSKATASRETHYGTKISKPINVTSKEIELDTKIIKSSRPITTNYDPVTGMPFMLTDISSLPSAYKVGHKVKVKYGEGDDCKIYECKILDVSRCNSGEPTYFVHYSGWNSRYDEWVVASRLSDSKFPSPTPTTPPGADRPMVARKQYRGSRCQRGSGVTAPSVRPRVGKSITVGMKVGKSVGVRKETFLGFQSVKHKRLSPLAARVTGSRRKSTKFEYNANKTSRVSFKGARVTQRLSCNKGDVADERIVLDPGNKSTLPRFGKFTKVSRSKSQNKTDFTSQLKKVSRERLSLIVKPSPQIGTQSTSVPKDSDQQTVGFIETGLLESPETQTESHSTPPKSANVSYFQPRVAPLQRVKAGAPRRNRGLSPCGVLASAHNEIGTTPKRFIQLPSGTSNSPIVSDPIVSPVHPASPISSPPHSPSQDVVLAPSLIAGSPNSYCSDSSTHSTTRKTRSSTKRKPPIVNQVAEGKTVKYSSDDQTPTMTETKNSRPLLRALQKQRATLACRLREVGCGGGSRADGEGNGNGSPGEGSTSWSNEGSGSDKPSWSRESEKMAPRKGGSRSSVGTATRVSRRGMTLRNRHPRGRASSRLSETKPPTLSSSQGSVSQPFKNSNATHVTDDADAFTYFLESVKVIVSDIGNIPVQGVSVMSTNDSHNITNPTESLLQAASDFREAELQKETIEECGVNSPFDDEEDDDLLGNLASDEDNSADSRQVAPRVTRRKRSWSRGGETGGKGVSESESDTAMEISNWSPHKPRSKKVLKQSEAVMDYRKELLQSEEIKEYRQQLLRRFPRVDFSLEMLPCDVTQRIVYLQDKLADMRQLHRGLKSELSLIDRRRRRCRRLKQLANKTEDNGGKRTPKTGSNGSGKGDEGTKEIVEEIEGCRAGVEVMDVDQDEATSEFRGADMGGNDSTIEATDYWDSPLKGNPLALNISPLEAFDEVKVDADIADDIAARVNKGDQIEEMSEPQVKTSEHTCLVAESYESNYNPNKCLQTSSPSTTLTEIETDTADELNDLHKSEYIPPELDTNSNKSDEEDVEPENKSHFEVSSHQDEVGGNNSLNCSRPLLTASHTLLNSAVIITKTLRDDNPQSSPDFHSPLNIQSDSEIHGRTEPLAAVTPQLESENTVISQSDTEKVNQQSLVVVTATPQASDNADM